MRAALVFLIVFLVYLPSVRNGFVLDDPYIILNNPNLSTLSDAPVLLSSEDTFQGRHTGYYRPVTYLTFLLDNLVWRGHAGGFHLTNALIHASVCVLLYLFLLRIWFGTGAAVIGALFFGLHPANNEAVNFISGGRNTLLCGAFLLAAFIAHTDGRRKLSVALYAAALFSKEFAIMLPVMLAAHALVAVRDKAAPRTMARELAPYAVVALVYLLMRSLVLKGGGIYVGLSAILHSAADLPRAFVLYAMLVLDPFSLMSPWHPKLNFHLGAGLAALLTAAAAVAVYVFRNRKAVLYGVFWYCVFLLPASAIVLLDENVLGADRYLYVAIIGAAIVLAYVCSLVDTRKAAAVMVLVLVVFAVRDVTRTFMWRDDERLMSQMVKDAPDLSVGYYNLAMSNMRKYEYEKAEPLLQMAAERGPLIPDAHFLLGIVKSFRGRYGDALRDMDRVLAIKPDDSRALVYKSYLLYMSGRNAEAEAMRAALDRDYPGIKAIIRSRALSLHKEGLVLLGTGRKDEAMAKFAVALQYDPYFPAASMQIGEILMERGEYARAAKAFQRVTVLDQSNQPAWYKLAIVLDRDGSPDEAAKAMRGYIELGGAPTVESERLLKGTVGGRR